MAIATWVFTCNNWFSMSRMTCLIIISGCSALSIRSFRLARIKVVTRSSSAIVPPNELFAQSFPTGADLHGRLVVEHLAQQNHSGQPQNQWTQDPRRLEHGPFRVVVDDLPENRNQHYVNHQHDQSCRPGGPSHVKEHECG